MKIFFLLFFLSSVLLSGCSTSYNYPSKKITVYKTNGDNKDYGLLSVRGDSAIAVLDWSEARVTPLPFSHVEVIKKDSIIKIVREGIGGGSSITLGIILGAAVGAGAGVLFSPSPPPPQPITISNLFVKPLIDISYQLEKVFIIGCSMILGSIIGGIIGNQFPPSIELAFPLSSDRVFLRSISAYPDKEPDEMQYIK